MLFVELGLELKRFVGLAFSAFGLKGFRVLVYVYWLRGSFRKMKGLHKDPP